MIFLKHDLDGFENDLRVIIQAFYYNEKVVSGDALSRVQTSEPELEERFTLEATACKQGVLLRLQEKEKCVEEQVAECDLQDKKGARNAIHATLYHMLVKYTGKTLPWGDLTGVRPTKLATELVEQGTSDEDIKSYFMDTYFTTEQKADMCIEVARREHELLKGIDFKEEYCLYVGIPFCPTRCLYCSFASYPLAMYADKVDAYLDALEQEIIYAAKAYEQKRLIAIYIGGGTPTALNAEQMDRLLTMLETHFDYQHLKEFTVEAGRPDSIDADKLKVLLAHDIKRISINPQTMHDETLKLIGRAHTVEETKKAFHLARELGFDNINMDMIVGLPGEDITHVKETLDALKELAPDSLTVHSLAIKRAANLNAQMEEYRSLIKGSTNEMLLAVDACARELELYPYYLYRQKNIPGNLENIGYAKQGLECLYNILIMEEKMDILALGAGASTKVIFHEENRIERVENVKNVDDYINRIDDMIARKRAMFETR